MSYDRCPERPSAPVLSFTAVCADCGTATEPCPAEGPGESWAQAAIWLRLALDQHKLTCLGRPGIGGQRSMFSLNG